MKLCLCWEVEILPHFHRQVRKHLFYFSTWIHQKLHMNTIRFLLHPFNKESAVNSGDLNTKHPNFEIIWIRNFFFSKIWIMWLPKPSQTKWKNCPNFQILGLILLSLSFHLLPNFDRVNESCFGATLSFQSHTHFSNWPTWQSANRPTWRSTTPNNMNRD